MDNANAANLKPFTMRLEFNNGQEGWDFPILPESIRMKRDGSGNEYKIIGGQRIRSIDKPGLAEIEIESFFPASRYPFNGRIAHTKRKTYWELDTAKTTSKADPASLLDRMFNPKARKEKIAGIKKKLRMVTVSRPDPNGYVADLDRWMASGHPVRFVYAGLDPSNLKTKIWKAMAINAFERWEEAGSPGDVYFRLQLIEYSFYYPIKIRAVTDLDGGPKQVKEPPKREDLRVPDKTYTIKAGDTLIKIAMRMYDGDSSRYPDIMKENKITWAGTRTLQIGRVLNIPRP